MPPLGAKKKAGEKCEAMESVELQPREWLLCLKLQNGGEIDLWRRAYTRNHIALYKSIYPGIHTK